MQIRDRSYDPTFVKEWCVFILNFFHEIGKNQALYENLNRQTQKFFVDNNKKGLNEMLWTIYSMSITSPENDRAQLNERLMKEFGKQLNDVKPKQRKHRALKGEKLEQLKFMGDWCITILYFLKKTDTNDPSNFFGGSIDTIKLAIESNDFHGMKAAYNDINEMARGLSKDQIEELNKKLKEKFKRTLSDEEKEIQKKIDRIIKRGKMLRDEEFYLVKSYIDELIIANDDGRLNKLNKILFDYENDKTKTKN
jgi:hypothetical protein